MDPYVLKLCKVQYTVCEVQYKVCKVVQYKVCKAEGLAIQLNVICHTKHNIKAIDQLLSHFTSPTLLSTLNSLLPSPNSQNYDEYLKAVNSGQNMRDVTTSSITAHLAEFGVDGHLISSKIRGMSGRHVQ